MNKKVIIFIIIITSTTSTTESLPAISDYLQFNKSQIIPCVISFIAGTYINYLYVQHIWLKKYNIFCHNPQCIKCNHPR